MISVNENVSAHTSRRLSETLGSKTALFSSTNFGEVYVFKIYYSPIILFVKFEFVGFIAVVFPYLRKMKEKNRRSRPEILLVVLNGRLYANFPCITHSLRELKQCTKFSANRSKRRQNFNGSGSSILFFRFSQIPKVYRYKIQ